MVIFVVAIPKTIPCKGIPFKAAPAGRVRDIKVRRFAQTPANRENPGVHHTARQSRDREGALANSVAGMRPLTVAARIGASRPSTFMSRTPAGTPLQKDLHLLDRKPGRRPVFGSLADAFVPHRQNCA